MHPLVDLSSSHYRHNALAVLDMHRLNICVLVELFYTAVCGVLCAFPFLFNAISISTNQLGGRRVTH